jgi:hypothetical protein
MPLWSSIREALHIDTYCRILIQPLRYDILRGVINERYEALRKAVHSPPEQADLAGFSGQSQPDIWRLKTGGMCDHAMDFTPIWAPSQKGRRLRAFRHH